MSETDNVRQMRERIEQLQADLADREGTIESLTSKVRGYRLTEAGVPEKAHGRVMRMLDGEESLDWDDPKSISTLLEESGVAFVGGESTNSNQTAEDMERVGSQERIGALRSSGQPPHGGPLDIKDQIAAAEASGDISSALALKSAQMAKQAGMSL